MEIPKKAHTTIPYCWFCNREPAEERRALKVYLHRNLGKNPRGQVTYQTTAVAIPRCAECAWAHAQEMGLIITAFLVGGLAGMFLFGVISERVARATGWHHTFFWALFVGFGAAGGFVGLALVSGLTKRLLGDRRSSSDSDDYPAVHELIERGWKPGSKPSKADVRRAA
jgi:hypothetical protein